jgi:hypothetical protein
VEEEKEHEKKRSKIMGSLKEFVVAISAQGQYFSYMPHSMQDDLIGPIDMKVSQACGMIAATPVQYTTDILYCAAISPFQI